MTTQVLDFGFYPRKLDISAGPVVVRSLPSREKTVEDLLTCEGIESEWIYAPPERVHEFMSDQIRALPYSARVFGLPMTHQIEHTTSNDAVHLAFHLWSLSLFTGMRLTATEAGFLDATPLKPGALVDFSPSRKTVERSVELAEDFWNANASVPTHAQRFAAAVHALFLGQNPRNLQFERFIYLYAALDACYALAAALHPPTKPLPHAERIEWMCSLYGMTLPTWADPTTPGRAEIAAIRNDTVHEALFMDAPLGFALHGVGTGRNLTLEMQALICRLLVALVGGQAAYVQTPVTTRQCHGLDLT